MKEIRLSQGLFAQVDDEDYEILNQFNWYAFKTKHTYYAANDKLGLMHRFILKTPSDKITDHKDHNGLNNQRNNIWICTYSENNLNRVSRLNNNYHPIGVIKVINKKKYKDKIYEYQYYLIYINIRGKQKNIGMCKTETQAVNRYNEAVIKYHGEFANLNIIE